MTAETVLNAQRAKMTLVLPIQLESKNKRDRMHWRQRHALRLSYQGIISLKYPLKHPTPDYKQRVTVTRIMGPREREWDTQNGYAGSMIELCDSLTHLGWWVDDSPRWLEPVFAQARHKTIRGPATLVEIEEIV